MVEIWFYRHMMKIIWADEIQNEEMLNEAQRKGHNGNILFVQV